MVNNRMVISFEEPKNLDEVFQCQHVLRTLYRIQEEDNGYSVNKVMTCGYELVELDEKWFTWYRKIVVYYNDNYENKILRKIRKPYYVV